MNDHEAKREFQPSGYCPRCDYRTEEGTCPECGLAIRPGQLRKRPRTWLRKRARALLVTAAILVGVGWFARARPELVPYFPTFYLLDLQVSSGPLSIPARKELAKRYANGRLSQSHLTRFVMQWADVSWHSDEVQPLLLLRNSFANSGSPISSKMPLFSFEESVGRLTLDGTEVSLPAGPGQRGKAMLNSKDFSRSDPIARTRYMFAISKAKRIRYSVTVLPDNFPLVRQSPPGRSLTRQQGFYGSTLLLMPNCDPGPHHFKIETTVVVTELGTSKVMASWPLTHDFDIDVEERTSFWSPFDAGSWQSGREDLLFPYGEIPGEFSPDELLRKEPGNVP